MFTYILFPRVIHTSYINIRHIVDFQLLFRIGSRIVATVWLKLNIDLRVFLMHQIQQPTGIAERRQSTHCQGFMFAACVHRGDYNRTASRQCGNKTRRCQEQTHKSCLSFHSFLPHFLMGVQKNKNSGQSVYILAARIQH